MLDRHLLSVKGRKGVSAAAWRERRCSRTHGDHFGRLSNSWTTIHQPSHRGAMQISLCLLSVLYVYTQKISKVGTIQWWGLVAPLAGHQVVRVNEMSSVMKSDLRHTVKVNVNRGSHLLFPHYCSTCDLPWLSNSHEMPDRYVQLSTWWKSSMTSSRISAMFDLTF